MVSISIIAPFYSLTCTHRTYYRIWGTDGSQEYGRECNFHDCVNNTKKYGDSSRIIDLPDWHATKKMFPALSSVSNHSEPKSSFQAIFNGNAGWVKSMDAMLVIKRECERLGVEFVSGLSGTVDKLIRSEVDQTVAGVVTVDGTEWYADKIILAAGAYCDTLLDFKGQLKAVRESFMMTLCIASLTAP
jgi:sarcosine oxidase/L-pipecolate oxidase